MHSVFEPRTKKALGSKMAQGGVQNTRQHGGALRIPHDSSFDDGILYLSKDSDVQDIADTSSLHLVQDGGTISLLAGDSDNMVDMYQVQDPRSEWMKSKYKSLSSIEFDGAGEENVGDILSLSSDSKVDTLMTMGEQLLNSDDSGLILCPDGVNLVTSGISGNDAKCSDIMPLCNILSDDLTSQTDRVLCASSSSHMWNSSSMGSSHEEDESKKGLGAMSLLGSSSTSFGDIQTSLDSSGITFTAFTDKNMSKLEPESDDLVQASQTNILETNSSLVSSTQSLLGGGSITSVASSGSDCGLMTSIIPNFLGIESSPGSELNILNDCGTDGESFQQSVFLTNCDSSEGTTLTSNGDSSKVDLNDPRNVTLAVISVSTDQDGNSTQIVLNTSQGQQMYMVNAAALGQGAVVAQPLSLGGSSVHGFQSSGSQNQIVLLPVVNGDMVSGMLETQQTSNGMIDEAQFVCDLPGCGKVFNKRSLLKRHTMQHSGERPFRCQREGCDWAFSTAYKLNRHQKSHDGEKLFVCDVPGCNRQFTTIYNLNTHRHLHDRPCNEECPEPGCEERFPTKRLLEQHIKIHNGSQRTYRCPHPGCKCMFFSSTALGSHNRVHKESIAAAEFRCEFEGCNKVFDRQCRLRQHERQHTGEKPFKCAVEGCQWAFYTSSKLKRHSLKHQNVRKFKCNICDKSFMRSEHLKGHSVIHSGDRPFKCTIAGCDARFTAKSSLYVHLGKHAQDGNDMVFRCPVDGCTRKYNSKKTLRDHLTSHLMKNDATISSEIAQLLMNDETSAQGEEELMITDQGEGDEEEEGQYSEDGVEISGDQVNGDAVSQLLAQPITISDQPLRQSMGPVMISLETNSNRPLLLRNRSGCARTDFESNYRLRRTIDANDDPANMMNDTDLDSSSNQSDNSMEFGKRDPHLYAAPQPIAALTYHDPQTGRTFVHTQLLQDDPPNAVYYSGDPMGLTSDSGDVTAHMLDSAFPNTTINLDDLV